MPVRVPSFETGAFSDASEGIISHVPVASYIDDLGLYATTFEEYLQRLETMLERLDSYDIRLNQTRKSPIPTQAPVPPIPDLAGKRWMEPPIPDSESGNREPPFPDSAGNGNRGPDSAGRGFPGLG